MSRKRPVSAPAKELDERMRRIVERHGRSAGEVAIAWALRNSAITAVIVGVRSANQARDVLGALEFGLRPEEIAEIAAVEYAA